jgi:hypothetical protein
MDLTQPAAAFAMLDLSEGQLRLAVSWDLDHLATR